jgi:predicted ester cyclase
VAEYEAGMQSFHTGFPDFKVSIESVEVKGNKAYVHWIAKGTNTGVFNENPPTGKTVNIPGFAIWTFDEEGRPVREDSFWDNLAMMTQMGYTLTPPAAE